MPRTTAVPGPAIIGTHIALRRLTAVSMQVFVVKAQLACHSFERHSDRPDWLMVSEYRSTVSKFNLGTPH